MSNTVPVRNAVIITAMTIVGRMSACCPLAGMVPTTPPTSPANTGASPLRGATITPGNPLASVPPRPETTVPTNSMSTPLAKYSGFVPANIRAAIEIATVILMIPIRPPAIVFKIKALADISFDSFYPRQLRPYRPEGSPSYLAEPERLVGYPLNPKRCFRAWTGKPNGHLAQS